MRKSWSAQGRGEGAGLLLGLIDRLWAELCTGARGQSRWQRVGGRECSRSLRLMLQDAHTRACPRTCSKAQRWRRPQQIGQQQLVTHPHPRPRVCSAAQHWAAIQHIPPASGWSPTRVHAPEIAKAEAPQSGKGATHETTH